MLRCSGKTCYVCKGLYFSAIKNHFYFLSTLWFCFYAFPFYYNWFTSWWNSSPWVNPIKLKIMLKYRKTNFLCNKSDCFMIGKIVICVTNTLAYHCKIREFYRIVSLSSEWTTFITLFSTDFIACLFNSILHVSHKLQNKYMFSFSSSSSFDRCIPVVPNRIRGTLGCRELVTAVPPIVTIPQSLYLLNQLGVPPNISNYK